MGRDKIFFKMEESIKVAHSQMKEFICICALDYNCMQAGKTELTSERTETCP